MDWTRFLAIASCPDCRAPLALAPAEDALHCGNGHCFQLDDGRIPLFDPPREPASERQRLDDEEQAAAYAGMRAFAAEALGRGEAEGLYRTVSDLLLRALLGKPVQFLLDLGCGSGRTVVDAATAFPSALTVGVDRNPSALTIAYAAACLAGQAVSIDLRRWGFGSRSFVGRRLTNVFLAQADAERLPFARRPDWPGFDAVTCVNLLDRAKNPMAVLDSAASVLRPGGILVLTTPLNWQQFDGALWQGLAGVQDLRTEVEKRGLRVEAAFDGLVYREIQDARGSASDWRIAVVQARRGA